MSENELEKVKQIIKSFKKDNYRKLHNKPVTTKLEHFKELFKSENLDFNSYISLIQDEVKTELQKRQKQGIH